MGCAYIHVGKTLILVKLIDLKNIVHEIKTPKRMGREIKFNCAGNMLRLLCLVYKDKLKS